MRKVRTAWAPIISELIVVLRGKFDFLETIPNNVLFNQISINLFHPPQSKKDSQTESPKESQRQKVNLEVFLA